MKIANIFKLVGAAAIMSATVPASATVITRNFNFTATNFGGSPIQADSPLSITGAFSVSYDPAVNTGFVDTIGVQSFSVNTTHASFAFTPSQLVYQNRPSAIPGVFTGEYLAIGRPSGHVGDDANSVYFDYADFSLTVSRVIIGPTTLVNDSLCYSQTGNAGVLCTGPGGLVVTDAGAAAVPEPATWAMLIAGFGVAGATYRRRKRRDLLAI